MLSHADVAELVDLPTQAGALDSKSVYTNKPSLSGSDMQ